MPTNYGLRTPLYAQATTGNSLVKSAKLSLNIDGSLIYAIVKDVVTSVPVVFEIAELLRDYLEVTLSETFATPVPQKITFTSTITFYSAVNAGGSVVGSPVTRLGGDGYEGYSLFIDGTNSSIPYRNRSASAATWLLAEKTPATAATNDDFVIFVPEGYSGYAGHMDSSGVISYGLHYNRHEYKHKQHTSNY
jgi:hypothetical protein